MNIFSLYKARNHARDQLIAQLDLEKKLREERKALFYELEKSSLERYRKMTKKQLMAENNKLWLEESERPFEYGGMPELWRSGVAKMISLKQAMKEKGLS